MSTNHLPAIPGALALYKGNPSIVTTVGDRIEISLPGGKTQRVRRKDIEVLHPGPLGDLDELAPPPGDVQEAWEILEGETTSLQELAELAYGDFTPAAAWAAHLVVEDGLRFEQGPDGLVGLGREEAEARQSARAAKDEQSRAREAFLDRTRRGIVADEDEHFLQPVAEMAYGRTMRSDVLRALGQAESPENAHALLLRLGRWNGSENPHPSRLDVELSIPTGELSIPDDPLRVDLTGMQAFAIDDRESTTPDDAVSVHEGRIWVHIADPAIAVAAGSPLDIEARRRAETLHLPERIIHMFPEEAIAELGLGLQEVSPALSVSAELSDEGGLEGVEIVPSMVRVTRVSYEEADVLLHESDHPLSDLDDLTDILRHRREAGGAVSLSMPEVAIRVRPDGEIDIRPLPPTHSRALVQECMILAGRAVACWAHARNIPIPYTSQQGPKDPARATSLAEMYALRRQMQRSTRHCVPDRHTGLGVDMYTQATSPLRRYLDLVVHQQIRSFLAGSALLTGDQIVERIGAVEALIPSLRQAELRSERHWTLAFLLRHPGQRLPAVVVDRRDRVHTVLIPSLGLEEKVYSDVLLDLDAEVELEVKGVDLPRLEIRLTMV